jgi:hypothetical protein
MTLLFTVTITSAFVVRPNLDSKTVHGSTFHPHKRYCPVNFKDIMKSTVTVRLTHVLVPSTFASSFPFRLYESNDATAAQEESLSNNVPNNEINTNMDNNVEQSNHHHNDKEEEELHQMILQKFETYYPTTATKPPQKLLTFHLKEYKPLGLTAEESLAQKDVSGTYHHVFVSKVIPNGNADKVGIQVGDVIVGISGLFGSIECVVGESLEKVKGMIASQKDHDDHGLVIKVMRGSLVMNDHESALVDLCTLPENETKVNECIEALYKRDYDLKVANNDEKDDDMVPCDDAETECMLETLFSSWGDEMNVDVEDDTNELEQEESQAQKPAPWNSRSSPSGTFVRDPKTGKVTNIDA